MGWVLELAANIPEFLTYAVPGYLFLAVYKFVLFKDEDAAGQTSHTLLNSVIASFILKTLYDWTVCRLLNVPGSSYTVCLLVISLLAGYCSAKVILMPPVIGIMQRLGINRTASTSIWNDFIEDGLWLRVWLRDSERSYYGQVALMENFSREPLILLKRYQFLDDDGAVLVDNTEDDGRMVLMNLSNFERVEIAE